MNVPVVNSNNHQHQQIIIDESVDNKNAIESIWKAHDAILKIINPKTNVLLNPQTDVLFISEKHPDLEVFAVSTINQKFLGVFNRELPVIGMPQFPINKDWTKITPNDIINATGEAYKNLEKAIKNVNVDSNSFKKLFSRAIYNYINKVRDI
jgi:hypothetical protein